MYYEILYTGLINEGYSFFFMSSNRTFSIKNVFLSSSIKKVWVFFVFVPASYLKNSFFFSPYQRFFNCKETKSFLIYFKFDGK